MRDLPVKVVKEREHVIAELDPAFLDLAGKNVTIHDLRWIIDTES